jgi:[acyl-carrier-protein] S-malonyltransferase
MQQATPVGTGAMAALLGLDLPEVQAIAEEAAQGEVCQAANDNAPGQVVVSGHAAAVERATEIAKEKGAKRAVLLPVSAPFHCALMAPAADVMGEALEAVTILPPSLPVVSNVAAAPAVDPATIRRLLVEQVTGMVRWREGVLAMRDLEVDCLVELGNGKVLSGLTRRIEREMNSLNAGTPEEIEALLAAL